MKDKTIEDTDKRANEVINIYKGLGWMTTALDPSLFQYFWAGSSEWHFISKLRAHSYALDKDVDNHFPVQQKELLKKAVDEFAEANSLYQATHKRETSWRLELKRRLRQRWYLYQLREKGKTAFAETMVLMASCKKTKKTDE